MLDPRLAEAVSFIQASVTEANQLVDDMIRRIEALPPCQQRGPERREVVRELRQIKTLLGHKG